MAGKFNCYKVAMSKIGQTFWIGVEGARPLVKFQSGNVEAELVKVWTINVGDEVMKFAIAAGWGDPNASAPWTQQGAESEEYIDNPDNRQQRISVTVKKLYTPKAEIAQALQKAMATRTKASGDRLRPESVEAFEIGGKQALRCEVGPGPIAEEFQTTYYVWIRTESTAVEFTAIFKPSEFSVFRWKFDPVLAAVKVP